MKQNKADRKNFIFVTEYQCNISVLENECVEDTLSLKYVGYSRIVGYRIHLSVLYYKNIIYIRYTVF